MDSVPEIPDVAVIGTLSSNGSSESVHAIKILQPGNDVDSEGDALKLNVKKQPTNGDVVVHQSYPGARARFVLTALAQRKTDGTIEPVHFIVYVTHLHRM